MTGKTRYILMAAVAMVTALTGHAEDRMTFLDWDMIAKDTVCPVYSEVVPLETDYRQNTYEVSIEFPTWVELNERETALAMRHSDMIGEMPVVRQYVSVSRGKGMLNYSFVPIIRRNGKYSKLLNAKIVITPSPLPAEARRTAMRETKRYADNSVLATGKWKKIHITKDGMYRMTPQFLAGMGFTDPDRVHLYGYGGHQQSEAMDADKDFDDLEEVPLFRRTDGSLLFWGNGLVHWEGTERVFNAYATKATYFLTEGEVRNVMATAEEYTGSVRQTVTTRLGHALHEVDDYAWFRGGRNLVESTLFAGAYSRTYTLSGINSLGNEKLTVVFTGNDVATPLTIWANGARVTTRTIPAPGEYMYYSEGVFRNVNVMECNAGSENWKITLATQGVAATSSRVQGRLDYISMNFTAPLVPQDGYVHFGGGYEGTGTGTGTSPGVVRQYAGATRFAGIGDPDAVRELKVMRLGTRRRPAMLVPTKKSEDNTLYFATEDGKDEFVAFDPDHAFPAPVAGQTVENQNLHAVESADMVIIVPAGGKLTAQAQRLAEAHGQYDGLTCAVVRADMIYNEFSSGTPDATAYRRFMKMLYDRGMENGTAPRYLLLMGDCAWDNRMKSQTWRAFSPDDYLLCHQSENSYSDTQAYCWEDYFGLMDDGEGTAPFQDVPDIGIGRFPVTTETQARIMVDKTISHLRRDNAGDWCNKVVVMGDDGDKTRHMTDANAVADRIAETATDVDVRKIMWDSYQRVNQGLHYSYPEVHSLIEKHVREGAMMFNYSGHGATYLLSHERAVTLEDVKAWKTTRPGLWYTAACDISPFDSQEDNIGEAAVLNEGGGAVAFIGTTHTVYSTQNFYLDRYFSQYMFSNDGEGRRNSIGDALRLAKGSVVNNGYDGVQPQNKLQYALLGDPSLMFGNPRAKVVLDNIDGEPLDGRQQLKGGSKVRLSGHIEGTGGSVDRTFRGLLSYRIYDNRSTVTTRGNTDGESFTYRDWNKEICSGTDSVRNGEFAFTTIIPKDINYSDENGRMVFYAVSDDRTTEANGSTEDFIVGGYSRDMDTDTSGPEIFMYLNDRNFTDGDAVNSRPVFVAELYDESGIQSGSIGIGHNMQLCIDGNPAMTYNLNPYFAQNTGDYSRGSVYFADMPELPDGAHHLSFRAWDVMNNTSVKTLKFVVGKNLVPELLSLMPETDIVSGQTNFRIGYNLPGLECRFTLDILTTGGALLWKQEVTAAGDNGMVTIPWTGRGGNGAPASDGIYICRVTASYGGGAKSHREKKFIFRGNK
ncbi:MAG: type IX secretion system sortase PorU [Bacteroidaceae bacterium]|nr:type IX secretion system sortase PorU [Bacteroidaceae bacterium]